MDDNQVGNLKDVANTKISKSIGAFEKDLLTVRTGRASAKILDNVKVDYYGAVQSIDQLGTITVPEARMIVINVWDRAAVIAVESAIVTANLGINPQVDGIKIKLPIPPLSEERRKEMVKKASEYGEKTRIAIRQIRKTFLDDLKALQKNKVISEDDLKLESENFEKQIKKVNENIESILAKKSKDIMQI